MCDKPLRPEFTRVYGYMLNHTEARMFGEATDDAGPRDEESDYRRADLLEMSREALVELVLQHQQATDRAVR